MTRGRGFRLIIMCALLTGCGGVWVKPGATQADFQADQFNCRALAYQMQGGISRTDLADTLIVADNMSDCMRSKGYTYRRQ